MVTFGILSDARLSQDCCADAGAGIPKNPASAVRQRSRLHFMVVSLLLRFCGGENFLFGGGLYTRSSGRGG
jgi:hypothetical protein